MIISFLFVLLHFKFDIAAGHAYGLLFYYSILEQLVNDVTNDVGKILESFYDNGTYVDDHDNSYEFMRLKVLPFLSSIENLKPTFTGSMKICFGEAQKIDHLILGYIHPIIATFLVVLIYILARNFVFAA